MSTQSDRWTKLFRELALLHNVIRAGIARADTSILIQQAGVFAREFDTGITDHHYRSALAATLIAIYDILDARLKTAARDSNGLPVVPGVQWNRRSPLAGMLEDVPPFASLDRWTSSLEPRMAVRRRRRPRTTNIVMDEMVIRGHSPRRQLELARPQLPRSTSEFQLESAAEEIAHWVEIIEKSAGGAALVLEFLELEVAALAVGSVEVFFAVIAVPVHMWATWTEADRLAYGNGWLLGYSQAIAGMWEPFIYRDLDLARWPAIPNFHGNPPNEPTAAGQKAREGYLAGVREARQDVQRMEAEERFKGPDVLVAAHREWRSPYGIRVAILRRLDARDADIGALH